MNEPWLCPRCGRMNAPFNPACFCAPDDEIETSVKSSGTSSEHVTDAARYLNPDALRKILEEEKRKNEIAIGIAPNFYGGRCYICDGFHALGQVCATLTNNLPPNGEFI